MDSIRRIEIKTRRLSQNMLSGGYRSAFKGRGMSFAEVREYQYGDDVRDIDWNVTARLNRPYVKLYEEERELTVVLLIDVSGSSEFGTHSMPKREKMAEVAATLAFSAMMNNDKVGVVFFSDAIEKYIAPQKGRKHVLNIIHDLLSLNPKSKQTDIGNALEFCNKVIKRRCTMFLLSDFNQPIDYEKALTYNSKKNDMVALQIYDSVERKLPNVGLLRIKDAETGSETVVDTSDKRLRDAYAWHWTTRQQRLKSLLMRNKIDSAMIATDEDYIDPLLKLFNQR